MTCQTNLGHGRLYPKPGDYTGAVITIGVGIMTGGALHLALVIKMDRRVTLDDNQRLDPHIDAGVKLSRIAIGIDKRDRVTAIKIGAQKPSLARDQMRSTSHGDNAGGDLTQADCAIVT